MRKVFGFGKGVLKVLFLGAVLAGTFVMNSIGAIICAITSH